MDPLNALDLSVPPQRDPDRSSFDLRPRAVDEWLKNLPIASLGEASRTLFETLSEVNGLSIRPSQRQAFLERLDERIEYVVDGLRKHYPPREFPLPAKSQRVAELSLTLLREMARGHHIVVQAARAGERMRRATVALSIYRCIRYLSALLVETYGLYRPCPTDLWRTLHQLYREAERRGLLHLAVADIGLGRSRRDSISGAYRQILLLAAAGPYRMRHGETIDAYRLLRIWAQRAELRPLDAPGADEAMFIVALDQDLPPLPAAGTDGVDDTENCLALLTDGLAAFAPDAPKPRWRWPWHRPAPEADPALVRRLIISLGAVPRRQLTRLPVAKLNQVQAVIGLSHIVRTVGEADDPGFDASEASFVSRDVARAERRPEDMWDLIYTSSRDLETVSLASSGARQPPAAETPHWRLLNISAGGYCLLSDPNRSTRAQVGELIALREVDASRPSVWRPGVIRWMKYTPGDGLRLGVQMLAPGLRPLSVQPRLEDGSMGASTRALLLPEVAPIGQAQTLLLPCLPAYDSQRTVRLHGAQAQGEVVLTRRLETTGAFAQFEFGGGEMPTRTTELETVFTSL